MERIGTKVCDNTIECTSIQTETQQQDDGPDRQTARQKYKQPIKSEMPRDKSVT